MPALRESRMSPPKPHEKTPVAILGAGLTGMSAAIELGKAGCEHRIFEKLGHAGGHAITVEEDGYRFDRTGHLLHLRDPEMRKRVLGWIGDDHVSIRRRSRVWSNGVYTRYPFQANTHGLPPDVAYECLLGFLDAHAAQSAPDLSAPENFEEYCDRYFGKGISKHFMIPYNTKLWGVSPREITAEWCERFVPRPKLEDVLAGAVGANDRELGYNARFAYPRTGIGALPRAMAAELPHLELGRAPERIDAKARTLHFADETVPYDVLLSSIPLSVLLGLIDDLPEPVRAAASRLRCTHLYYLDVALSAPCPHDFHWAYVPEAKYPFYRVGCYSHFSSGMAPAGAANLYVELSDRGEPDMVTLAPEVGRALAEMGFIGAESDVAFTRIRKIDFAYVLFDHEYYGALEVIRPYLDSVGIVSSGRYGGWNYSSMEDALIFGRDAARQARGWLS